MLNKFVMIPPFILLNDNFEKKRFKEDIDRVVSKHDCPDCHGQRLNDTVLSCKINGLNIAEFTNLQIDEALAFLRKNKIRQSTCDYRAT